MIIFGSGWWQNNTLEKSRKISVVLLLVLLSFQVKAQLLDIRIENIRSSKGTIFLAFYRDSQGFLEEKPFMVKKFSKQGLTGGYLSVQVSMSPGHFGVALLDDENDDGQMEYNWMGIPREGFGFSDYYAKGFKKPVFEDFDFDLGDEVKKIRIEIRYIM